MPPLPRKNYPWLLFAAILLIAVFLVSSRRKSLADPIKDAPADRIVVTKSTHAMTLYSHGQSLKTYKVALGRGGPGQKTAAGDNKVPEGVYRIIGRNPHSAFHLALRVGYPTPGQVREAAARGVSPGGDIMVHGIRNGLGWLGPLQRQVDWTKGCIAVTNPEIEEIWRSVPDGATIEIDP